MGDEPVTGGAEPGGGSVTGGDGDGDVESEIVTVAVAACAAN